VPVAALHRVPAVNAGIHQRQIGGCDSCGAAPALMPEWEDDSPQSHTLLVPMSRQTAGQISSLRLQLGGVLLHQDCTQRWTHMYSYRQQRMAIAMQRGSVALVEGAQLQPCTLLRCNLMPETCALVIRAVWPLSPPGQPVGYR
jgi:hypothetical protein